MLKRRLFTPGPTEVPPETLAAGARPILHHRKKEFGEIYTETVNNLKKVFVSEGEVFVFASSGTGAMEAAVTNFTSPGDKVLVIESGKFGERWKQLCGVFETDVNLLECRWGSSADPAEVEKILKENPGIKAVFATLVETSTGALHPIEELASVSSSAGALLIVDAVSGLGCDRILTDEWGVDVVVSGSQKALMTPPGLGFICVNSRAAEVYRENNRKNYYWDLRKASKSLEKFQTPYTPSVNLIAGLLASLESINSEGMENVWDRHRKLAAGTRAGIEAMGLDIFPENPACGLTAVKIPSPEKIGSGFVKHCQDRYGIVFAGGQADLKGKIFRIAHMGYYDELDVIKALAAVEAGLRDLGERDVLGRGVKAALEVFTT